METLEKIAPNPVRLDIGGERLELTPLTARDLPEIMAAAAPILGELASGNIAYAIAKNLRAVHAVVAVCTGRQAAWVGEQKLKDQVRLLKACFEANADFFASEVIPAVTEVLEGMADVLGPMQSTLSSLADTASTKS